MSTISELQNRITTALQRIDSEIEARATVAANDLVALVSNRVIQRGETSDGGTFTPYSNTPVPAFFFLGKSRNGGADGKVKQKSKKHELLSYKQFRELNNLNTTPKNFEFTGEMWRGFSVLSVEKSGSGVLVTIGGKTKASEEKITWNTAQERRSIIRPSAKELAILQKQLTAWVQSLIDG